MDKEQNFFIKEGETVCIGFLNKMDIDVGTMKQLRTMITHESVDQPRVMPDVHRGAGNCVGFTSHLTNKILPRFIGGDIGCGILTYNIGNIDLDLVQLDKQIKEKIPMGSGQRVGECVWKDPIATDQDIEWLCKESQNQAYQFAKAYETHFDLESRSLIEFIPNYSKKWFENKCIFLRSELHNILCSIATLGGGNHFAEINQSSSQNNKYITIHTGSRAFGHLIYQYHQDKIDNTKHFDYDDFKDYMKNVKRKTKVSKERKQCEDEYREQFENQKHTDYLEDEEAYEYFFDMIFAQNIAKLNRRVMLREILKFINLEYDEENVIESIHNYINFEDMIIRKGAISAHEGQLCVIALNMKDGILLGKGKGNEEWNFSSAHGAGRVLPRNIAQQKLNLKDFQETMKDVYTTSVSDETIDESPQCYKNSERIMELIGPNMEIIDILKPILNIKAA
jgi:tRNA-splicing ligase RtcB (3'-phosphate/5'-hydroxy nucleic acid ligase)